MLDSETKRRIDNCRDILVGKVPDPKSQVEQITIALIYKFMDDMDAQAEELGGKHSFFINGFEKYGWSKLLAPEMGGQDTLNLYSEAITKMTENTHLPVLFRDIFKNAYLPYRDPETLRAFLKEINTFSYDHSERLGDAFEYLLSVLGSQGDAGQFRTPRHIIDFVVNSVNPSKSESILDPACGTSGFLISAYKHILKENSPEVERSKWRQEINTSVYETTIENPTHYSGSLLSPEEKQILHSNIKGYDISPDMVRISLVNLYLHGFRSPNVEEYDTLTKEDYWQNYFDVILANPPFMTPKGGIKPHKRFSIDSKRAELLFLDFIIEHLNPTGKAGVVVPEGIVFVKQNAYSSVRKKLIQENLLVAVIELPHGVFKPYASVKTHLLILDKRIAKTSDKVLFINVTNDGYTQSDTRQAIELNDLPIALKILEAFKSGQDLEIYANGPIEYLQVDKKRILESTDCHLIGRWYLLENKFREIRQKISQSKLLGEICNIHRGQHSNMNSTPGDYPLVVPATERKSSINYSFDFPSICIPLVSSAGHGKADIKRLHYQEGKYALADTMCCLEIKNQKEISARYVYEYLSIYKDELITPMMSGATNVTLDSKDLEKIPVILPTMDQQIEIVRGILANESADKLEKILVEIRSSIDDTKSISDEIENQIKKLRLISEKSLKLQVF